jgi:hypothetical protein
MNSEKWSTDIMPTTTVAEPLLKFLPKVIHQEEKGSHFSRTQGTALNIPPKVTHFFYILP